MAAELGSPCAPEEVEFPDAPPDADAVVELTAPASIEATDAAELPASAFSGADVVAADCAPEPVGPPEPVDVEFGEPPVPWSDEWDPQAIATTATVAVTTRRAQVWMGVVFIG